MSKKAKPGLRLRRALFAFTGQIIKPQFPIPKSWPSFYLLKIPSGGYGLFAHGGKHPGAGMGLFWKESGDLILYGTFMRRGGMAYSDWKYKRRYKLKRPGVIAAVEGQVKP